MLIFDTDLDTTARIIQIFGLPAIVGVIIWATKVFVKAQQEMKNTRDTGPSCGRGIRSCGRYDTKYTRQSLA